MAEEKEPSVTERLDFAVRKGCLDTVKCQVVESECKPTAEHLHIAVKRGYLGIVKHIVIDGGFKPTTEHLNAAIKSGYFDMVKLLVVESGCKPTTENLDMALQAKYLDIVKCLIIDGGCKPTSQHLNIAIRKGCTATVKLLVIEGMCQPTTAHLDIAFEREHNMKFLSRCKKNTKKICISIDGKYTETIKCLVDDCGCKPTIEHLDVAIRNGWLDVLKCLVIKGECKPTTEHLYAAVERMYFDIVEYLVVECDCKPTTEHLNTAFQAECYNEKIIECLVVNGGCKLTSGLLDIVLQAKRFYNIEYIRCLIADGGCKPTAKHLSFALQTKLISYEEKKEVIKCLVVDGGCTPTAEHLNIAIREEYTDIVEWLVVDGWCTPTAEHLNTAIREEYTDIVKWLVVDGGCIPTAEQLNIAIKEGYTNIVKWLVVDGECKPTTGNLCFAILMKNTAAVECLVIDGRCKTTIKHLNIAFHILYYNKKIIKCLIRHGGCKPTTEHLNTAIERLDIEIMKFLVVDGECKPTGENLSTAIQTGHIDTVKCLIIEGDCKPTTLDREVAIFREYYDIMNFLDKFNALDIAIKRGDFYNVKFQVVKRGCKPTTKHLDTAIQNKPYCTQIMEFLVLDGGCKPTIEHLNTAIQRGCADIVKFLVVDCGYEPIDEHFDDAIQKGYADIVKFLVVDNGFKPTAEHFNTAIQRHSYNVHIVKCLVVDGGCKPITEHLNIPIEIGCIETVEYLVVGCGCRPTAEQLYVAIQKKYNKIAHILIDSKHIDLKPQVGPQQQTVLHVACDTGQLSIAEHLIKDGRCSIAKEDRGGNTVLHLACYREHYEMVKVLLGTGKCDVNVRNMNSNAPLDLSNNPKIIRELIKYGANLSNVYRTFGSVLGNSPRQPIEAPVKIFVTGDPRGGKSTLTKSLQNEASAFKHFFLPAKKVSGVNEKTAGVIPCQYESKQYGSVTFYDLAGQREFYSSHSAVLSNTICFSRPIFLLVIDLQRSKEELKQSILYWLCFLENQCSSVNGKPHLVIIGSHADILKSRGKDPEQKGSIVSTVISQLKSTWFTYSGFIPMDCQYPQSSEINRLRHRLHISCKALRVTSTIQFNCHCFLVYLNDKFSKCPAVTLQQVQDSILACSDKNNLTNFVPLNLEVLLKLCEQLNDRGHILFLKNTTEIEDSWIIIDKTALLSEVTGTIFAPEGFEQHCKLASSTGVVPLSQIVHHFPKHNSDMLISFFIHLEFCNKICDHETLQLIEKHQSLSRSYYMAITSTDSYSAAAGEVDCFNSSRAQSSSLHTDQYFLFPSLISIDSPDQVWETNSQFSFQCGWMLQCSQPTQFFTSRFLQVLLLRIAFAFALIPHRQEMDPSVPALQRKCSIWRNGIFWGDQNGVEVLVEVVENKRVIVFMQSQHLTSECVCLRSSIINKVLITASNICPKVSITESFIKPTDVQYPIDSASELTCFSISAVAASISEAKTAVVAITGKPLLLESLLTFEPYAMLSPPILHKLFDMANDEEDITDNFLMDFSHACCDKMTAPHKLAMLLECLKVNKSDYLFCVDQEPREYRENPVHRCFLLLKTWKDQTAHPTLQALKRVLDQHSIFRGRNPKVI